MKLCNTLHFKFTSEQRILKFFPLCTYAYGSFPSEQLTLWVICFGHTLISFLLGKSNVEPQKDSGQQKGEKAKRFD